MLWGVQVPESAFSFIYSSAPPYDICAEASILHEIMLSYFPADIIFSKKKHFELYLLSLIYILQCVGQNVYDQLNVYCVGCFA